MRNVDKLILVLVVIFCCSAPCFAADWFVRSDGGTTSRCTGHTDAADPGSGTAQPCAYAEPKDAIVAAACGDVIKAKAGHTFDGIWNLPNKSCTVSTPVTLTSTATLPNRRVGPADASLMPRFRTIGTTTVDGVSYPYGAVFVSKANAGWWILDGLEITDNVAASFNVAFLFDIGVTNAGPHDFVFKRLYIHQKEGDTTDYTRGVQRGVQGEGTNITLTQSWIKLIGYYPPEIAGNSTTRMDTCAFLSVIGPGPLTVSDNYINCWWNALFWGGSDTAPQHTATLTSASTTSATYSNVTSVFAGDIHRFGILGTGTVSDEPGYSCYGGNTCINVTGATAAGLTSADNYVNGNYGATMLVTSTVDPAKSGLGRVMIVTGDSIELLIATSVLATLPNGGATWEYYQTAQVTGKVGSVVSYTPYGINQLLHTPQNAAWNHGDEGRIVDSLVQRNTFEVDALFAADVYASTGNCPKGIWEGKNIDRQLIEGNYFIGYPAVMAWTAVSQNGTAPWTIVDHVVIRNNWFEFNTGIPECTRSAIIVSDDSYLNTISPMTSLEISNNLILHSRSFLEMKFGDGWTIKHNTVLNTEGTMFGSNSTIVNQNGASPGMNFRDNIVYYVCNGMNCPIAPNTVATCWPGGTFLNNVIVDANAGCSGGITTSIWGTGSGLSPIPTTEAGIGFTNAAGGIYSLAPSSNYKNGATDGTDPGVNWVTLLAALGAGGQSSAISGRVIVSGKVVIN